MRTHFTSHFLNYLTNNYKIYKKSNELSFIESNFSTLKDIIENAALNFILPKYLDDISYFPFGEYYFLKDKIRSVINDQGVTVAIGINEFKIRDTCNTPEILISKIDSDLHPLISTLKYIYNDIESAFYILKQIQLLETNYILPEKENNYFKYLTRIHYDRDDPNTGLETSALNYFIFERLFEILYKSIFADFEKLCKQNIIDLHHPFDNKNNLINSISFSSSFAIKTTNIIIRNIFYNRTLLTTDEYYLQISQFLQNGELNILKTKMQQFFNTYLDARFDKRFIYQLNKNLQKYLVANILLVSDDNLFRIIDPTTNISSYINNNIDEFTIYNYLMDNMRGLGLETIKQLEFISYQFNTDPMQFINCHYFIYDQFLKNFSDMLNTSENLSFDTSDVTTLSESNIELAINNIVFNSQLFINRVYNEVDYNLIHNTKIIEHTCLEIYIEWIDKFITSDLFLEYLLKGFIPRLINISKGNNPISESVILDKLDTIQKYFKILLIDEVINNGLFSIFTTHFKNSVSEVLGDNANNLNSLLYSSISVPKYNKETIDFFIENVFKQYSPFDITTYRDQLNDFYISSVFSEVLFQILLEFSI